MKRIVKALTFDQSINLLPSEFLPCNKFSGQKRLLNTPKGVIAFRHSSLLSCGEWKTSYNEEAIHNEIDYLIYALGYDGILLLSRDILLSFKNQNYRGRWANNGYPIHVYKENERYFWHGMNGNTKDLTKYFISSSKL